MEIAFILKKLVAALIIPPFNLFVIALFGLLMTKRWPRFSRVLVWVPLALIVALATPAVSRLLMSPFSVRTLDPETVKTAQAIVVLGGGLRSNTPEYGDTPSQFTLDRIRYGATLARQTGLPVLVTGGAVSTDTPEADSMAATMKGEFGVPVKWIESRALDTEDNLEYSAAILKPEGITRVLLVTHDFHMRRALIHCKTFAIECIPAPVSFQGHGANGLWIYELPDSYGLWISSLAIHEILGCIALWLKD